ncbi:BBE domain-containing protein [Peribacillus kribbensis]|nr:BBE domain-containing protein [Peribacillus kribbensis]
MRRLLEYFGSDAKRLNGVKGKYDPYNVYRFPQGL